MKKIPEALSIEDQFINLKSLGLTIGDEEYAKSVLDNISYYRLIKAYSLSLKPHNGSYNSNVSFEDIVQLYQFNVHLRQSLYTVIEEVEVNLRCKLSNYFSMKYGCTEYLNPCNFADKEFHKEFLASIEKEIQRNKRAPIVKNFIENYEGSVLPLYALVEIVSFGTLSKFFKNMKNEDKKLVSKMFGVGYIYFESWIESISYVRNICAHYGRLYNAKMSKTPKLYKQYFEQGIGNNRLFGTLLCLKNLVGERKSWRKFIKELEKLINQYSVVNIKTMGFPENWKSLLTE